MDRSVFERTQPGAGLDLVPMSSPVTTAQRGQSPRAAGEFWLDGKAIFLGCPDCRAPMSVRLWLLTADCWRCGASIELSEEQERQVEQLLAKQQEIEPEPQAELNLAPELSIEDVDSATPGAGLLPADGVEDVHLRPWLRQLISVTPAWLISMLVHLILFTLLALLTLQEQEKPGPFITLSAALQKRVKEGGEMVRIQPNDEAQFDLPLPRKANLTDDRQRKVLLTAAQDARELRLEDDTPNLPDVRAVKARVGSADGYEVALAARDPRLRVEMVTLEGGTTLTEAAVARGLRWLTNHQNSDGSWSLSGFHHAGDCNCTGNGAYSTKAPGTALALLPYLGAGQTHLAGRYKGTVSRGLRWLLDSQRNDGDLRGSSKGSEGMYTQGQAAIVLCEAFAMTGDETLRRPAQKAIDFIVAAQYDDGGWRYQPSPLNQRGDTSVVGWQLMALQSARAAKLAVSDETWALADLYLDGVQHREGALYGYQSHSSPTPTMTAEALLCRIYLGWDKQRPTLRRGVAWLSENHQPSRTSANIYYWYYATQLMHHFGGREWEEWNQQMRELLVASQETRGHAAGSWTPRGEWSSEGGRIYMTALAVCTLEVYYRHLPIFRRIEVQ